MNALNFSHIEQRMMTGKSYCFSIYFYESIEDYWAMITMENKYGNVYESKIPKQWAVLRKIIGTELTVKTIATMEAERAYA